MQLPDHGPVGSYAGMGAPIKQQVDEFRCSLDRWIGAGSGFRDL